jgi:hypothetical protein
MFDNTVSYSDPSYPSVEWLLALYSQRTAKDRHRFHYEFVFAIQYDIFQLEFVGRLPLH